MSFTTFDLIYIILKLFYCSNLLHSLRIQFRKKNIVVGITTQVAFPTRKWKMSKKIIWEQRLINRKYLKSIRLIMRHNSCSICNMQNTTSRCEFYAKKFLWIWYHKWDKLSMYTVLYIHCTEKFFCRKTDWVNLNPPLVHYSEHSNLFYI